MSDHCSFSPLTLNVETALRAINTMSTSERDTLVNCLAFSPSTSNPHPTDAAISSFPPFSALHSPSTSNPHPTNAAISEFSFPPPFSASHSPSASNPHPTNASISSLPPPFSGNLAELAFGVASASTAVSSSETGADQYPIASSTFSSYTLGGALGPMAESNQGPPTSASPSIARSHSTSRRGAGGPVQTTRENRHQEFGRANKAEGKRPTIPETTAQLSTAPFRSPSGTAPVMALHLPPRGGLVSLPSGMRPKWLPVFITDEKDPRLKPVLRTAVNLQVVFLLWSNEFFTSHRSREVTGSEDEALNSSQRRTRDALDIAAVRHGYAPLTNTSELRKKVYTIAREVKVVWRDFLVPWIPHMFPFIIPPSSLGYLVGSHEYVLYVQDKVTMLTRKEQSLLIYPFTEADEPVYMFPFQSMPVLFTTTRILWGDEYSPAVVEPGYFSDGTKPNTISTSCTLLHAAAEAYLCDLQGKKRPAMSGNNYHDVYGHYLSNAVAVEHSVFLGPRLQDFMSKITLEGRSFYEEWHFREGQVPIEATSLSKFGDLSKPGVPIPSLTMEISDVSMEEAFNFNNPSTAAPSSVVVPALSYKFYDFLDVSCRRQL